MTYLRNFFLFALGICLVLSAWSQIYGMILYLGLDGFIAPDKSSEVFSTILVLVVYLGVIFSGIKRYKIFLIFSSIYFFSTWISVFSILSEPINLMNKLSQTFNSNLPPHSYILTIFLAGCFSLALFLIEIYESRSKKKVADASA